ncbi:hypothetical protein IGS68_20745 [Skermanella sp. TT6]|uniref:Uncharacterized protein n=1 Tax=Skermanella cutis TaxID=2775420 RepID=A0ABX7B299_9PROT|nr:hypothetical protein IGS68_20745 [Skermanella sp. TT6]
MVHPDADPRLSRRLAAGVLAAAGRVAREQGVTCYLTVSDPVLERVLVWAGAAPRRLGTPVVDRHGFTALALEIDSGPATIARLDMAAQGERVKMAA